MFTRIFNLIQTNKLPLDTRPARQPALSLLHLALAPPFLHRQRELGIDELESEFPALVALLKCVHGAELEVHGVGVRKVFEKGKELDDVVLLHDLEADGVGGPLFVDWDDHAAARDGEGGGDAARC